jgi:flagellar basal body-associated protein FliL
MRSTFHSNALAAAFGLLASAGTCAAQTPGPEQLQQVIIELQEQNQTLQRSLAEANRGEKQASEQLAQVRERLEALGKNLLDGGDDRLIQAAADLQLANERIAELEGAPPGSPLPSTTTSARRWSPIRMQDCVLKLH